MHDKMRIQIEQDMAEQAFLVAQETRRLEQQQNELKLQEYE